MASAIGCIVGTQLLVLLPTWLLSIVMGLFALTYVISALRRGRPPLGERTERTLGPFVGFGAGILNGTVGASGPILARTSMRSACAPAISRSPISSVFALMSVVRIFSIAALGAYTSASLTLGALIVVPAVVGQRIGFVIQRGSTTAASNWRSWSS